ncbi:MAG TPA: hypothetical protein VKB88_16120 [Bryobacteraceae bacterium]|nr:hypothetical protein [Bryobacteraceae bacterium]
MENLAERVLQVQRFRRGPTQNAIVTGLALRITCPVGVSVPLSASMRNSTLCGRIERAVPADGEHRDHATVIGDDGEAPGGFDGEVHAVAPPASVRPRMCVFSERRGMPRTSWQNFDVSPHKAGAGVREYHWLEDTGRIALLLCVAKNDPRTGPVAPKGRYSSISCGAGLGFSPCSPTWRFSVTRVTGLVHPDRTVDSTRPAFALSSPGLCFPE